MPKGHVLFLVQIVHVMQTSGDPLHLKLLGDLDSAANHDELRASGTGLAMLQPVTDGTQANPAVRNRPALPFSRSRRTDCSPWSDSIHQLTAGVATERYFSHSADSVSRVAACDCLHLDHIISSRVSHFSARLVCFTYLSNNTLA
jgi:hypothetical protein